jgi:hypothetical protein
VELEPSNTRALQALMMALFFNRQLAESLRVGEQALALNPNDTELMGEFGARLALSGQWERGTKLLEEALDRNPEGGSYYNAILALAAYMRQDYETAAIQIQQADPRKFPLFHMAAAMIYAQRGMMAEAARERDILAETSPNFFRNIDAELGKRNFRPEDRAYLIACFRRAILLVPGVASPVPSSTPLGAAIARLDATRRGSDGFAAETPVLDHLGGP